MLNFEILANFIYVWSLVTAAHTWGMREGGEDSQTLPWALQKNKRLWNTRTLLSESLWLLHQILLFECNVSERFCDQASDL